jgi:hypothetical protein
MDLSEQVIRALLDGADEGTGKLVLLGATAAAGKLWTRVRKQLRRRQASLDATARTVLASKSGHEVDLEVLRRLVRMLSAEELQDDLELYRSYVAGDVVGDGAIKYEVGGDFITHGGTKNEIAGDQINISNVINYGG